MSRQDKATTERHTKTLREMLKWPENKLCADCKRNDPRWASWNLGVFMCIRCSGIHRSMGTHISKVKSVDLDVWTPEQMASIQKWGNRRANIYWEAHLKAGHIPPDHKMESFIRSKYESRRWAMEGPPPTDPSVLDEGGAAPAEASDPPPSAVAPPTTTHTTATAYRATHNSTPSNTSARSTPVSRQPQPHQLLSTTVAGRQTQAVPAGATPTQQAPPPAPAPAPAAPANELFSLDFHSPAPTAVTQQAAPRKDVKQDILSLFSSASAAAPAPQAFGQFAATPAPAPAQQNVWGGFGGAPQVPAQPPQQSMMGNAGVGMWGANSGWNSASSGLAQSNVWGGSAASAAAPQQSLFNTNDLWASSGGGAAGAGTAQTQKKDDVFGDIWGDFK